MTTRPPRPSEADAVRPASPETVAQYAAWLHDGCSTKEVLSELTERIDAHCDIDGYCGNGCNVGGWMLAHPCPTRLFYLAVREHLCDAPQATQLGASTQPDARPAVEVR